MNKLAILATISVLLVVLSVSATPKAHAATGTVCIVSSGTTGCPATPVVITGSSTVGSSLTVAVNIAASDGLNGASISVLSDPTVLNPVSISSAGTVVPGNTLTLTNCVNGAPQNGAQCTPGVDGVGVASLGILSLGSATIGPTTGLLFTVTYTIEATTSGSPLRFQSSAANCSGQSITGTTDCVLITSGAAVIPETDQGATFVNAAALDTTSTAVACSPGTIVPTGHSTCTATVSDMTTPTNIPTGAVAFISSNTAVGTVTASCILLSGKCTATFTGLAAGTATVNGNYGGDSKDKTSSGTSNTITVAKDNTSTGVGAVSCNIALGGTSCTASVTATVVDTTTASKSATGTVTFTLTAGTTGGSLSSPSCILSTTAGVTSCSVVFTGTSAGSGSVTAGYSGDATHNTSTSASATVIVTAAVKDSTSTSVACSPAAIVPTGTSTCTATVIDTTTASNSPTGTVGFTSSNTAVGTVGASCILASGKCTVTFTGVSVGTATVTGTYSGDSTHNGSSGTSGTITVAKDTTSTGAGNVICTIALGVSSCTASVVATVTDTTTATNSPTGSITFALTAGTTGGTLSATSCTLSTTAGVTSCSVTFSGTTVGSGFVVPAYGGDSTHNGSTGVFAAINVFVASDNSSTSVGNVSCTIALGGSSCTASVTATVVDTTTAANTPTGTVTFTLTAGTTGGSLSSPTCMLSTTAGVTSCSVTFTGTTVGSGSVMGSYGGDTTHNSSMSTSATITVSAAGKDNTSTSIACSPSTIVPTGTSSCSVTVADTTTPSNAPGGSVSFTSSNTGVATVGATCTLSAGKCTVTLTGVAPGTATVTGIYSGDSTHNGSTGTSNTVTVALDNTSTSVGNISCNIALGGSSCTASVIATVVNTATASNSPTGTVTLTLTAGTTGGTLSSATCILSTTAAVTSCSVTFTGTTGGSGSVTAMYGGDSAHNASTSSAATVTVTATVVPFDYSLSNNGPVSIQQGSSGTVAITATLKAGTAQPVTLSCVSSSLPSGITCGSFTVNPVTPTGSSILMINVAASVAAGSYSFMVTGSPLGATTTPTTVNLMVTSAPPHATTTTVSCSPPSVQVNSQTTCTATVTDTSSSGATSPTGMVSFSTNSTGTFSPTSATCALTTGTTAGIASCSVSYTPTVTGHHLITGSYSGDSTHSTSTGSFTVVVSSVAPPLLHSTKTVVSCSPGSVLVNTSTSCTARVIDNSTSPTVPTGTVTFTTNSTGTFNPTSATCTLVAGNAPNMATCSVSYTPALTGKHQITGSYSGDSTHAKSSGNFTVNVRSSPGGSVLLTFNGFDVDDFENGVGQFQVLVNGQLVVDIPAGLNHLTGSGDYTSYTDRWVKFGPFDVTGLVVQDQNTIVFMDPLSSHFGLVRNTTIVQGGTILLQVHGAGTVHHGHSVNYTFSTASLVLTSFTASNMNTVEDQAVTFTATYTGGTAPFRCTFNFGDDESVTVASVGGTCSVVHDYDSSGNFTATVTVRGSSTSDKVSGSIVMTVRS